MIVTTEILKQLASKYELNSEQFKTINFKKYLSKKKFIFYSSEEYYFEINNNNESQGNFFPFFSESKSIDDIEVWIKSIKLTKNKNYKIVKNLSDGEEKRKNLKNKFNI